MASLASQRTGRNEVGENVGAVDGAKVGFEVVGVAVGDIDGMAVGRELIGAAVGSDDVGAADGVGAHVGSAVVRSLSTLDSNIRWVDSRRNVFRDTPSNVRAIESTDPALEVMAMPPNSCFLVMTHSHAIDFDICDRILRRGDAVYVT